jgi:hypothetical protein
VHQHQTITANGHDIKFNRVKTMGNSAAQSRHRILWRKNSTAPMGQYSRVSPHLSVSCHDALRWLR